MNRRELVQGPGITGLARHATALSAVISRATRGGEIKVRAAVARDGYEEADAIDGDL